MTAAPVLPDTSLNRPVAPIIVTALMGASDFAWADGLRRAHFPPERNFIPAHITLFHHLPPSGLDSLFCVMRDECRSVAPSARLTSVMSLGRGVAFRVESEELLAIRQRIADAFFGQLLPQDQHKPRFHITVQNKVDHRKAQALRTKLERDFAPRPLAIVGLAAWHYRGGPWEVAKQMKFRG